MAVCLSVTMFASCNKEYNRAFQLSFLPEGGIKVIKRQSLEYTKQDKLFTYNIQGKNWSSSFIPKEYISRKPEDLGGIVIVSKSEFNTLAQYVPKNPYGQDRNETYYIKQEYFTVRIIDPYAMKIVRSNKFEAEDLYHGKYPAETERVRTFYVDKDEVKLWVTQVWNLYLQGTTEEEMLVGTWGTWDNTSHFFWTFGDNGNFAYSYVQYIGRGIYHEEFIKGKFRVKGNIIEFYESQYDQNGDTSTFKYFDMSLYNEFPSDTLLTTPLKFKYYFGGYSVKFGFIGDKRLRIVGRYVNNDGDFDKVFKYMD